jgi:3-oxoacyl-[acyl-carrier protein] reductase
MAPTAVRDGKRAAIVTGGATGVGAATAVMLARRGYDVAIMFSKSRNEAEETAALCEREGARAIAIQGSVAEDAACKSAVAETVQAFGCLDALVNSAGATQFVPAKINGGKHA